MKALLIVLFAVVLVFVHANCTKEHSFEASREPVVNTLPSNYSFSTGYCSEGESSLGITIIDTVNFTPADTSTLPANFMLDMPVAGNQGRQNSCATWATVYGAGSYFVHQTKGKPYSDTGNLSPGFIYNQISKGGCTCSSILDNLYLLKTVGSCSLGAMPFKDSDCSTQPNNSQKGNARKHVIHGWQKVQLEQLALIKRALVEKHPVIFAIQIDDGFKRLSSPYIWKSASGTSAGAHAMVITGYDDGKNAFRIMNSWSNKWADNGFAWIDYQMFLARIIDHGYIIV